MLTDVRFGRTLKRGIIRPKLAGMLSAMCRCLNVGCFLALLTACQGDLARADSEIRIEAGALPVEQAGKPEEIPKFVVKACDSIETEARRNGLPAGFFARLIWKESRFDPNAVSPKGARGIAQFMPATARERGLADPFDPETALAASAAYLIDLRDQFGNLGLAAAAYNAGPDRVARWRRAKSRLPRETRNFVHAITGLTADQWAEPDVDVPDFALHKTLPFARACQEFARLARPGPRDTGGEKPATKPWGALIASNFTKRGAEAALKRLAGSHTLVAEYEPIEFLRRRNAARGGKLMYRVMLGADDRNSARSLCRKMNRGGGACMVVRN